MAKSKYDFSTKIQVQLPSVKFKADTSKLKTTITNTLTKGAQRGAIYVQTDLKKVLNQSIVRVGAVDTGRLKNSLGIESRVSSAGRGFSVNYKITYKTPYAAFVHYGGVMRPYGNPYAALRTIPGRPWITEGLRVLNFETPFSRGMTQVWKAQFG